MEWPSVAYDGLGVYWRMASDPRPVFAQPFSDALSTSSDDGFSTDEWFFRSEPRIAQECPTTVGGAITLSSSSASPICEARSGSIRAGYAHNVIPRTDRYPRGSR